MSDLKSLCREQPNCPQLLPVEFRNTKATGKPDSVIPQIPQQAVLNDATSARRSDNLQERARATPHGWEQLIKSSVVIEVKMRKKNGLHAIQIRPWQFMKAVPSAIQQQSMICGPGSNTGRNAIVFSNFTKDFKFDHRQACRS
ncbi:MAG: hypothetical protein ACK58J_17055 [Planctomyces sp.]